MSLTSALIGKRIEYPESCRPQTQREPQRRCHFFVGQGKSCFQELRNLIFLPGFCFQAREQCNCKHRFLLGSTISSVATLALWQVDMPLARSPNLIVYLP